MTPEEAESRRRSEVMTRTLQGPTSFGPGSHCATCRHWGWPPEVQVQDDDFRDCTIASDWPFLHVREPEGRRRGMARVAPFAGSDGGVVSTPPAFGCVEWEPST